MDAQRIDTQGSGIDAASEGLDLPGDIQLIEKLGQSRINAVYRARYQGQDVAVKAYSNRAASAWRKKLDQNIAIYEMLQNRAFRQQPDLVPYTAKPIKVIGQDGKGSLCYLQAYVDGISLEELAQRENGLPGAIIRTGELIQRVCEDKGLQGVDQFLQNVKVVQQGDNWSPVVYDFKHIPEESRKKPPVGVPLLARIGIGAKPGAPAGFVKDWNRISRRYEPSG